MKIERYNQTRIRYATDELADMMFIDARNLDEYVASLSGLREYHVNAAAELMAYADDPGMQKSNVKHYRKRAAMHDAFVSIIDGVKP